MTPKEPMNEALVGQSVCYVRAPGAFEYDVIDDVVAGGDFPVVRLRYRGQSKMDPDSERVGSWHFCLPDDR